MSRLGRRRERSLGLLAAACAGAITFSSLPAGAATETWDNGGGDQLWSNSVNWSPDAAVDGNDARFTNTTAVAAQTTVTSIVDGCCAASRATCRWSTGRQTPDRAPLFCYGSTGHAR